MRSRQQRKYSLLFLMVAYIVLAWAIPLIISIGRLLSSAGSSAFVFPKFMDFVDGWNHHSNSTMAPQNHTMTDMHRMHGCDAPGGQQECMSTTAISIALVSVICNIIVNLFTRIPAIFTEFRSHYHHLKGQNIDLSLMSITDFATLDQKTLVEKPCLIKDMNGHYRLWGYKEGKWQFTEINPHVEIPKNWPSEWTAGTTVLVSSTEKIFNTLKEGHTPPPRKTTRYFDFNGMTLSSGTIYAALKSVNLTSGGFVALSTYLSIKSLGEFLEQCLLHTTIAEHHPQARAALYESMALLFAATSFANYFIYNVRTGDKNAKSFATNITQGRLVPFDRTLLATLASSSPATICVGPMAFFTTFHALQKICWINIPAEVRYTIAGISFATASAARILTDIPAMYHLMETKFHPERHSGTEYTSCMVTPYKSTVYAAGFFDSAVTTGVINFTGLVNTAEMVLKVQQTNPALITVAATCAASAGGLNFAFGVHNGVKKGLPLFFKSKPKSEPLYQRLATSEAEADNMEQPDVEAGISIPAAVTDITPAAAAATAPTLASSAEPSPVNTSLAA